MFCGNCGNELKDGTKFCTACGTNIVTGVSDRQTSGSTEYSYINNDMSSLDSKTKTQRYITGTCFIVTAIISFSMMGILGLIGYALVAAAIFARKPGLLTVGSGFLILNAPGESLKFWGVVNALPYLLNTDSDVSKTSSIFIVIVVIAGIIDVVLWAIMLTISINITKANKLGTVVCVIAILSLVTYVALLVLGSIEVLILGLTIAGMVIRVLEFVGLFLFMKVIKQSIPYGVAW